MTTPLADAEDRYCIWSFEHDAWWGPNHRGYTRELAQAGRYNAAEAGRILASANIVREEERMVHEVQAESWFNWLKQISAHLGRG